VVRPVVVLERVEQAEALLKPQRIEVLRQLATPRSCTEVGHRLGQTPQRVYYHVRRLVEAGLVRQVAERRVRGITEGIYQAGARSFWLSPSLIGRLEPTPADRDAAHLEHLLDLVERVQADIAALDPGAPELPSLGVTGQVRVAPDRRTQFLAELRTVLQDLCTRYDDAGGEAFALTLACYPAPEGDLH
jgi:DNA-binding transcriptional ArsR family regulator